jgi:ribosomal protein S18 acetylase RimI-like enzyme
MNRKSRRSQRTARLADGRSLQVGLATVQDLETIAEAHPLPRLSPFPERPLRTYFTGKAWLYVTTERSGVMLGKVDGTLAGFVFFSASESRLRRSAISLRGLRWVLGRFVRGRFGGPRLWWSYLRWALQHFRRPARYDSAEPGVRPAALPDAEVQIGTVHTIERFRRLGVANAVMEATEDWLREQGASEVFLWAAVENSAALQLYERRGYVRVAEVSRIGERCFLMARKLTSPTLMAAPEGDGCP